LISCTVAKRNISCSERKADLFIFIEKKNRSHTYILPHMTMILAAALKLVEIRNTGIHILLFENSVALQVHNFHLQIF